MAQSNPNVVIVLDKLTAHQGEIVTAEVMIRGAVNLGGADVGITVDEQCLKIVERTDGSFLPTSGENGGFSPFSELNEHDTRLAAAITDRSKLANGQGVFFSVSIQVTCASGTVPLTVVFAELSAYQNPSDATVVLDAYTMSNGNLTIGNTEIEIVGDSGTPVVTLSPVAATTQTAPVEATQGSSSPAATAALQPAADAGGSNAVLILVPLLCLGIIVLGGIFWFIRRSSREDEDEVVVEEEE
jgi:hypothetical protein